MTTLIQKALEFIQSEVENRRAAGGDMTDYVGEAQDAARALEAVLEELRWVPVEERLPADDGAVMIYDPDEGVCIGWKETDGPWRADYSSIPLEVTHWRPLIETPETGEEWAVTMAERRSRHDSDAREERRQMGICH